MNKNSSEPPFLHFSPQTYVFYCPFLPPISVAAMSTSPHEFNLCPMLPHHFLLRAKSLPGPTLRAPPKPEAGFRPLPSQVYIYINTYIFCKRSCVAICGTSLNDLHDPSRAAMRHGLQTLNCERVCVRRSVRRSRDQRSHSTAIFRG